MSITTLFYDVNSWTKCSSRRVAFQLVESPVNSSCHPSTRRGEIVHLVAPFTHLGISLCHCSSSRPSTRRVTRQLVVSHFNSPFRRLGKQSLVTSIAEWPQGPGHQRQDKGTAQAHVLPVLRKMDEVNVVKDILRDALSRIDQIPSQSSQSQSGNPSQHG